MEVLGQQGAGAYVLNLSWRELCFYHNDAHICEIGNERMWLGSVAALPTASGTLTHLLPTTVQALFRPITVMVPDRQLIMENMLMAEGFVEAKMLAKKFASLYYLLEDLLSPQKHYDWGLRAIKSVLVVAGSLLRAEAGQVESDVLFRALRDFNIPKILAQVRQCTHFFHGPRACSQVF